MSQPARLWPQRLAAGIIILLLVALDAWVVTPYSDDRCRAYLNESILLAASTYGTCRIINAGVSTLQESTVSVSPAGVGLGLQLGQILDPINDATERLSTASVSAMAILGAQRLFLTVSNEYLSLVLWVLLGVVALLVLAGRTSLGVVACKLVLLCLLVKLAIPAMCGIGIATNERYFHPHIDQQLLTLTAVTDIAAAEFEQPAPVVGRGPDSSDSGSWYQPDFLVALKNWIVSFSAIVSHRASKLSEAITYLSDHFIPITDSLTGLFVLILEKALIQALILPIATLFIIRLVYRGITGEEMTRFLREGVASVAGRPAAPDAEGAT